MSIRTFPCELQRYVEERDDFSFALRDIDIAVHILDFRDLSCPTIITDRELRQLFG
jgi:hypothetical protein